MTPIIKALPEDAGRWIDGHWGQYATARLILIASCYGFESDSVGIAKRKIASMGPSTSSGITEDEEEILDWESDIVESWMNENVAPPYYSFGWYDGEFFLWSDEYWAEVE